MTDIIKIAELGEKLTGIGVFLDPDEATAFNVSWDNDNKYINLNTEEIDDIFDSQLYARGFDYTYRYLQALLHEIAHYKQWLKYAKRNKKLWDSWNLDDSKNDYLEYQADKFAIMYYRRFIKERS